MDGSDNNNKKRKVSLLTLTGFGQTRRTSSRQNFSPSLNITREAYNLPQFNEKFAPINEKKSAIEHVNKLKPDLSRKAWIRRVTAVMPILTWLPNYDIKQNLLIDIVVGITVAIFQVPQGLHIIVTVL